MQLGTLERLERALVIDLMIAWRILHVVTWGRDCPDLPCDVVFAPEEWQAAWIVSHRCPPPAAPPNLGVMVRLIAGFGGFLGRQGDGHPGPKALWEGMQRIHAFAIGIAAAKEAFSPSDQLLGNRMPPARGAITLRCSPDLQLVKNRELEYATGKSVYLSLYLLQ